MNGAEGTSGGRERGEETIRHLFPVVWDGDEFEAARQMLDDFRRLRLRLGASLVREAEEDRQDLPERRVG